MAGNYPSDLLPAPSASGYSFSVEPVAQRYRMDSGRYRQVRNKTKQYRTVSVSWDLTDSQMELFEGFFNVVTGYGEHFFQINLAFGDGLKGASAQFVGGYTVSNTGIFNWRVTAELLCESIDEIDNQSELETAGASLGLVGTDWFTAIPNVQVGYSFEVHPSTIRTNMRGASYQNRNRFKRAVHLVSVSWSLSDLELEFFLGWHKVILGFGCYTFDMDLAFGDGYKTNKARFVNGAFTAIYTDFNSWTVTAQLECQSVDSIKTFSEYSTKLSNP